MPPFTIEVSRCKCAVIAASLTLLFSGGALQSTGAEAPARYTRFCGTCGFSGIESFSSQSGQFVVHSSSVRFRPIPGTNNPAIIQLEPQFVVVAAERAKEAVCAELRIPNASKDKVHIAVLDRAPLGQPVTVVAQIHSDGFVYKAGLPVQIDGIQFAKGLIHIVLLEQANRGARGCAELPRWLIEGMARQTITTIQPTYVMNRTPITFERAGYDRLAITRSFLETNSPLSIQQLSFPKVAGMTEEDRKRFEASSHLLVHRLLALPDGPALMARFIQTLPHTLNWQTALFSVYKNHFDGPLSFEKWWMLNWLEFRKRANPDHWQLQVTLDRLDSLLLTPVEIRKETNSVPTHRRATLQELIQTADFGTQRELITQKIQQMFFLSVNVPTEALPLWSAYQRALDSYLQRRDLLDYQPVLRTDPEQRLQSLLKSALKTLDELDFARSELNAGRTPILPKDLTIQARR
jgi:hypothetical protein